MKIIEPGHVYELNWLDGAPDVAVYPAGSVIPRQLYVAPHQLTFVNREKGTEHPGTQTQEVLRALIDRTRHCDRCLRWPGNDEIIRHLQLALVLHEARALERKTLKGILTPEAIETGPDGHFKLST